MAIYSGPISTYALNVHSKPSGTGYTRIIYLKGDFGLAFVNFIPDGASIPAGGRRGDSDTFDVYFPVSEWGPMVDLLRNETPAAFCYFEDEDLAQVSTWDEPLGEAEPVG